MSEPTQSLEEALFELAAQKTSATERADFLDGVCRDNPTLRARLDALLEGHFAGEGFFTQTPQREGMSEAITTLRAEEPVSLMIGRYKLLEKIGEGGFGEVWMAEQREPVKRRVALKIIKLGMDSRQVVARFEAERQALAMMDHPNIAKIFDAGTMEDGGPKSASRDPRSKQDPPTSYASPLIIGSGRPYFVMELVRGIKITEYCDQSQLTTRQRLDLFMKVCQAIQHAHQKGIIHRDIKPSNILVTVNDGVPVPKVIDFGIAKATQGELTDKTVFTQFQQFIGTPAYISPEQAEMSSLDIDTRADIYSLGVLLYELLVGQTPFDAREMVKGGIDALRQIVREKEPLRPSSKLNTLPGDARTTAGKRRQTEPGKLVHQLQGDLDWIVLKCLEKDRARRYETANGLAMDIQRHLANEPIAARPPSTAYRIQKAWQRNKLAFSAAAAVAFAVTLGGTVSTWQALVATRARTAAQKAEAVAVAKEQEAKAQRERADREAAIARRAAYNASVGSIQADWEKRNYARVRETLASQKDYSEPSFEWFYWQRMTHLEVSSFPTYAGGIKALRLSPDHTKAVLVMKDNSIEVRSVPEGEKLATFLGHGTMLPDINFPTDTADAAAFSPDGKFVASCGGKFFQGVVKLWNAQTGEEIRSFGNSTGGGNPNEPILPEQKVGNRQYALAFSPDGRWLATGGAHGKFGIQLWEVATGRKIRTLEVRETDPWIEQLAFSSDGKRLVCRVGGPTSGNPLLLYDVETGALLDSMGGNKKPPGVKGFALSPDSRRLAVQRDNLVVYDLTAEGFSKVLWGIPGASYPSGPMSFSPDGKRLVVRDNGDSIVYNAGTGEQELTLRGGSSQQLFLADSRRLISTDGDRRVKIWDASTQHEFVKVSTGFFPRAIARDGSRLVVHLPLDERRGLKSTRGEEHTGGLGVVDTATGKLISSMREHEPTNVDGAAFSPDNQWVVSGARDDTFRLWDARTGEVKWTVSTPRVQHLSIGFGPKGDTLISTLREPIQGYGIWDIATRALTFAPRREIGGYNWALSPDGRRLATGGIDGNVRVWDPATGDELRQWQAHERQQFNAFMDHFNESMDYSADGRHLVTGGLDGLVKLWDPETGRLERTLTGHASGVIGVRFTPDQRRLISRGNDGTIRIWDPATGKELLNLTDPLFEGMWLLYVTVSPDGRKLFAAPGRRREMIIWEVATPAQVAAWQREEEADAALWAAEQPKVEARRVARLKAGSEN